MEIKVIAMKKYIYVVLLLAFFGCSQDSSDTSSNTDGQGGSLATFLLKGNYLYTVDNYNLNVFNIQEETNPMKVNTISIGFNIETLFGFDDYLFIGSRNGMFIYDVKNPELPKRMSASEHFRSCDPVVANNDYAYVTLHSTAVCGGSINELQTYDIKNIEAPILLNTRGLDRPKGLSLYYNYLIVCDASDVKIFDVTNPINSIFIKSIPVALGIDVIIRENHLFIISENGLFQYQLNKDAIESFDKLSEYLL